MCSNEYPPIDNVRYKAIRIRQPNRTVNIGITAARDPRGADNNIYVWLDKDDKLHIRVLKAQRCYKFSEVIDTADYVEVIQA